METFEKVAIGDSTGIKLTKTTEQTIPMSKLIKLRDNCELRLKQFNDMIIKAQEIEK